MQLIHKISLYNLGILSFLLLIGGAISYFSLQGRINHQTDHELVSKAFEIFKLIESGYCDTFDIKSSTARVSFLNKADSAYYEELTKSKEETKHYDDEVDHFFPHSDNCIWIAFSDTVSYNELHHEQIKQRMLISIWESKGKSYQINTSHALLKPSEIFIETIGIIGIPWFAIIIIFIFVNPMLSKHLFNPFNATLHYIKEFNLAKKADAKRLPQSNITEFQLLNEFISQMANKNILHYKHQKEFAENVAHEIQTPIMEAKGKLELLLESENIGQKELEEINAGLDSLSKVSKLGTALGILTRIDNQEFQSKKPCDLSKLVKDKLEDLAEIIELKGIKLNYEIDVKILVFLDKSLADILISNLINNAIDHNVPQGNIDLSLSKGQFNISNTGSALRHNPNILFERFSKGNHLRKSLGLGLSIAKKICDAHGFAIEYQYEASKHTVTINF